MLSSRVLASNTSVPDTVRPSLPLPLARAPPPQVRMAYLAFGLRYCGRWDTYKLRFYRAVSRGLRTGRRKRYTRGPRLVSIYHPLLFRLFLQTGGRDTPPAHSSPLEPSKKTGGGDKTEKWPSSNKARLLPIGFAPC